MLAHRSCCLTVGAILFLVLVLCPVVAAPSHVGNAIAADLDQAFQSPPDAAKPWAYWWWLNANVTRESITRDLEAMKKNGIGGFLLFDVVGYGQQHVPSPPRRVEFLSPEWRQLVQYAMREAHRLGLEMSMNLSTCGGALRAPWDTGNDAPKCLQWSAVDVTGPRRVTCTLPSPQSPSIWNVALLAVRIDDKDAPAAEAALPAARDDVRFLNEPQQWREVVVKPNQPVAATEVVNLTDRSRFPGPRRVGRSARPLAAAAFPLHRDEREGIGIGRRYARSPGCREALQPFWKDDACRGWSVGRQDIDAFLQRQLGRRRSHLDVRLRAPVSESPRLCHLAVFAGAGRHDGEKLRNLAAVRARLQPHD